MKGKLNVAGPLSFQRIRVARHQHPTYKDAKNNSQRKCAFTEVALNCTSKQIHVLLSIILTTSFPTWIEMLWNNHDSITDDILHQHRICSNDLTIAYTDYVQRSTDCYLVVVKNLIKNVIEANIWNGKFQGKSILLPRISIIPTDVPITLKRIQIPIWLALAKNINKSQRQT